MTAEVAVMNTRGIAMAADSAITLTGIGKVYNSGDKLFALSKYYPVGIMFYGNASIMRISWDVIVKNYRDHLGNKSFDKLSEYKSDFINYLSRFHYFTEQNMIEYLEYSCKDFFSFVSYYFIISLRSELNGKENIELSEINSIFNASLKEISESMKEKEDQKHIKLDSYFIHSNTETIRNVMGNIFEEYELSKEQEEELIGLLKLYFQKCDDIDDYSGIVIAGYGEREIFPTICHFKVSGKLGDSLIYFDDEITQLGNQTGNYISLLAPFAQTEMVQQFLKGIDPNFYETIIEKVKTILNSLLPLISDTNKEKTEAISELLREYLANFSHKFYQGPIYDIISYMEKSELVSMAEAMVNLTALKRHVSDDNETVGGPIDVALITKGDGFIWIKKKTNYDPHLNMELSQNYFRSGINGNL